MSKPTRIKTARTDGKMESYLSARRRHLKEELDRIYYSLPYDEVQPVLSELKDTVECLSEMGSTHGPFSADEAPRSFRRRAA